jgi:hypothetical protein
MAPVRANRAPCGAARSHGSGRGKRRRALAGRWADVDGRGFRGGSGRGLKGGKMGESGGDMAPVRTNCASCGAARSHGSDAGNGAGRLPGVGLMLMGAGFAGRGGSGSGLKGGKLENPAEIWRPSGQIARHVERRVHMAQARGTAPGVSRALG